MSRYSPGESFTIMVNSTDSFQDCWEPFFTLFARYWPACPLPILLNTETKGFSYPGLEVTASQVGSSSVRGSVTWGEATLRCLDMVTSDVVLYLQEDYFLEAPVDVSRLHMFARLIREKRLNVIRILERDNSGPWTPSSHSDVWRVLPAAKYLVSLQAALWKTDVLRRIIRRHETPWETELYGSRRVRRQDIAIHCVDRDRFSGSGRELLPYQPTGILKGRWNRDVVVDLFAMHDIEVDFSARGFFDERVVPKRSFGRRITDRSQRAVRGLRSLR